MKAGRRTLDAAALRWIVIVTVAVPQRGGAPRGRGPPRSATAGTARQQRRGEKPGGASASVRREQSKSADAGGFRLRTASFLRFKGMCDAR
jgi:hypothetical protein